MYNEKSRHIFYKHSTIKHVVLFRIIFIDHVNSKENIEDLIPKGLLRELMFNSSRGMDLKPLKYEIFHFCFGKHTHEGQCIKLWYS